MVKTCFIISSIGAKDSEIRELADTKFDLVFEPVLKEAGYEVTRADKIGSPGSISNDIVNHIIKSDLVIADVSDSNVNVFYELAIRNACHKPVIVIKGEEQKMPFDIYDKRGIPLEMSDPRQWTDAKEELKTQVASAEKDPETASKSILTGYIKIDSKKELTTNDEINLQLKDLMSEVRSLRENRVSTKTSPTIASLDYQERRKLSMMNIINALDGEHSLPIKRMDLVKLISTQMGMPPGLASSYLRRLVVDRKIVEINGDQIDLKRTPTQTQIDESK